MTILTTHEINTGGIVSAADISAVIKTMEGEITTSPTNPPLVEESGSGVLAAQQYRYTYSYISWKLTNGYFDIVEETAESPQTKFTSAASKSAKIYFDPPPYGSSNGVIIYRNDSPAGFAASDTRAITIILDTDTSTYIDNIANGSRGKNSLTLNTFEINQPFSGTGQLGYSLPIPFKFESSSTVFQSINSSSPLVFDRDEDFLLFSVFYRGTDTVPAEVYTTVNSYNIWTHEHLPNTLGSNFPHPVPIPASELGISTNVSGSNILYISGMYTGARRSLGTGSGTFKSFAAQIKGPYLSPASEWSCPPDSRAIIVHGATQDSIYGTTQPSLNDRCNLMVLADSSALSSNKHQTYIGKYWRVGPIRISNPSSIYSGGPYGAWNRGHFSIFKSPLILSSNESVTIEHNETANIFGYVIEI